MFRLSLLWQLAGLFIAFDCASAHRSAAAKTDRPATAPAAAGQPGASEGPDSQGRYYADTFLPLREDVRTFEREPMNRYTYCIRNVATYECPSYANDGSLRRRQHKTIAHGTGFAYQVDGEETRLLTNEHVISWPFVTDPEHPLEDIPLGCKLLRQELHIVDNEDDEYDADDIPLSRVIDDRALDAAVVRAKSKLRVLPYRIGRSSALSTGDVVIVRGFPLGVFAAYNTGKIINTLDEDRFKQWDHTDFIVDAQLSSGNSGSPVLALNRKTGEYELVGMFHASYTRASSLNAVIAIEQLRELMFELKRSARSEAALAGEPQLSESEQRERLFAALSDPDFVPYVSLGSLYVRIRPIGPQLLFEIFSKRFPMDDHRLALILDAPAEGSIGKLQQVWVGNERGYRAYGLANLDAESAGAAKRLLLRLYALTNSTLTYRDLRSRAPDSRDAVQKRAAHQRMLSRAAAQDAEVAQQILELAQDKSPAADETALPLAAVMAQLRPPASLFAPPAAMAESTHH